MQPTVRQLLQSEHCLKSGCKHFRRELYLLLPLSIEAETEATAEAQAQAETTAEPENNFSAHWPKQTGAAVNRLAC